MSAMTPHILHELPHVLANLAEILAAKYPAASLDDYLSDPDEYPKLDPGDAEAMYCHGWLQGVVHSHGRHWIMDWLREIISEDLLTLPAEQALVVLRIPDGPGVPSQNTSRKD